MLILKKEKNVDKEQEENQEDQHGDEIGTEAIDFDFGKKEKNSEAHEKIQEMCSRLCSNSFHLGDECAL